MPRALLKPDAVPTLRLPPATKPTIPPANETTLKRRRTLGDEPGEDLYCFEGDGPREPREHCGRCGPRATTHDAGVQTSAEIPRPAQPPAVRNTSVGTDPRQGKQSVDTQANSFAKGVTSDWVQTDGSSDTAISASSTSIPVPSASDDDDSASDDDDSDDGDDEDDDEVKHPTYESFIKESCVGNRDARGSDSFWEPVPPRGTVPKKQSPLSARRWGEGAGLPGQRSGGGGWCVQAGEAIAIFSLLVCGSGYPTSLDVWSGPISSRKVNHSSAQAAFSTARAPLCSAHSRRWWPVSAYSQQSLAVGVSVPPHVVPAHRDYGTVGVETVDDGRCPDLFLAPLRPSDFRAASEKYAEDSGAMSSWTKP
ncbi:hypothetical protein ISCGN_014167 [Ixodes scapularis]